MVFFQFEKLGTPTLAITVYTKEGCPACVRAKKLLENNNYIYTEIMIGRDITREDVLSKFPGAKTAPIILVNDNQVAGAEELQLLIENNQLELLL